MDSLLKSDSFGKHVVIDVKDVTALSLVLVSEDYLKDWVKDLVQKIDMVAYGEPQVVHFGKQDPKLAGWTVVQLIETSNIVAHFNDLDDSACIDVFSCKDFKESDVEAQLKDWFQPSEINIRTFFRLENRFG
jgi:S-adenosylmethionine/arginine decarboxylase-like enzyme